MSARIRVTIVALAAEMKICRELRRRAVRRALLARPNAVVVS
jgi:hypothetical protein